MSAVDTTTIWLWLAIIASGLYHGINPGMGWPLAVSAGLMEKSPRAVLGALLPLSTGHLAAMLLVLLPFALLIALAEWQRPIQIATPMAIAEVRPTSIQRPTGLVALSRPSEMPSFCV